MRSHRPRASRVAALLTAAACAFGATACSLDSADDSDAVHVVVGYQSKTINTVTAGTLLRAGGQFEKRLGELTAKTGTKYVVDWQDFDTGAPITTGMVAGKIDIGSMGDYPLLINAARAGAQAGTRTEMLSITGWSARGSLNMIVVPPDSPARTLSDLRGRTISASVGSAGHGTAVHALDRLGIDPSSGVRVQNQQPQVGASALESGKADALAQFVAWPGLLVFQNKARLLYDGAELGVPTLHGVVARAAFSEQHPDVTTAFLAAQLDATRTLTEQPLTAAETVAKQTGLPAEVVYLYNGPGGTDFNTALKPSLVQALRGDIPYLKSIGSFEHAPDLDAFIQPKYLEAATRAAGADYTTNLARTENASVIRGHDPVCDTEVRASESAELWLAGRDDTQPAAGPTCLLKAVKAARTDGATVRAAYIIDPVLRTRWFADKAIWVRDGAEFVGFTTEDGARRYREQHPGSTELSFDQAVAEVSR